MSPTERRKRLSNRDVDVSITVRRRVNPGSKQRVLAGVLPKKVHPLEEIYFKAGLKELLEADPRFEGWEACFPLVTYPADLGRSRRETALKALIDWMDGFKYPNYSS
jgi:hypothetical protein